MNIKNIVKIQKIYRGFITRKKLLTNNDTFTFEILNILLNNFIIYSDSINQINKKLVNKKIRMPNFPSEISENIVKFAIYNKYKILPSWDIKSGDLNFFNKKVEVKAFSSDGPSSFGPTETWDYLYFVDATKYNNKYFIVYEIKLSNNSDIISNIKVNKNETYKNHCNQKRRPRICFKDLKNQLGSNINVIFDNFIDQLYQ